MPLDKRLSNMSDIKCLQMSVCESDLLNLRRQPLPSLLGPRTIGDQHMTHACGPVLRVQEFGMLLCPVKGGGVSGWRGEVRCHGIATAHHTGAYMQAAYS